MNKLNQAIEAIQLNFKDVPTHLKLAVSNYCMHVVNTPDSIDHVIGNAVDCAPFELQHWFHNDRNDPDVKSLSFKTRKRSLVHLKQFRSLAALEAIKRSIIDDLLTSNDVTSRHHAIALFEHRVVNTLITRIEMGIN